MAEIDPAFPMDRVLTDETRKRIMRGYRRVLSASDPEIEETEELSDELPLNVDAVLLKRFENNSIHAEVLIEHEDHPELVTDEVTDCPHHTAGDELSTLGDLGENYVELEKDLLEVSALMCDLLEYNEELQRSSIGRRSRIYSATTACSRSRSRSGYGRDRPGVPGLRARAGRAGRDSD